VLLELSPNKVPEGSRFLLEVKFTELTSAHLETQHYWTMAVNAALTASQLESKQGACSKRTRYKIKRKLSSRMKLGIMAVEHQIRSDRRHQAPSRALSNNSHQKHQTTLNSLVIQRPHPSSMLTSLKSNKRLRKPE
jgi:hypothetical protein